MCYHVMSTNVKFSCCFYFQGRFSINLQDTGIKLTSKVMWGSTGQAYSQIIYRYPVRMIISVVNKPEKVQTQSVIFSRGKSYKNQAKTIKSCLSVSGSMFTYNIGLLIC